MCYKQNTENCFKQIKLNNPEIIELLNEAQHAFNKIEKLKQEGLLPILSIAEQEEDLAEIENIANEIINNYDRLVVLGTGGSSLCGHALVGFCKNRKTAGLNNREVIFMQNVDPDSFAGLLSKIEIEKTAFLAISKSGESIETLTQLEFCLSIVPKNQFYIITTNTNNSLRRVADAQRIKILEHDPKIGGRFSILSNVGMLPAVVAGVNVRQLRKGAANFLLKEQRMAIEAAAIHVALMRIGRWQNVMMTYPDALEDFNIWHRQIWAESIGKNGTGSTPIKAMGTIDQHSQMQLYLAGRKDKFFTLIKHKFVQTNNRFSDMHKVFEAEAISTMQILSENNCPVRLIEISNLDEYHFGMLIMHFMLETILVAYLLGVDPFNQPAVEHGKLRTKEILASL